MIVYSKQYANIFFLFGILFAIIKLQRFVLSLCLCMNPETIEMQGQIVGVIFLATMFMVTFGPLVSEFIDMMKDIREWMKRS